MSLEEYFKQIDSVLVNPVFINVEIKKEKKSVNVGLLFGRAVLMDISEFHFMEYIEIDKKQPVITYRYHYQTKNNELIFRYDNSPHHKEIASFPHHKHLKVKVVHTKQKTLLEVVEEILILHR